MERNRRPASSRGGPATGAGTAEHPRLSEGYDRPERPVNVATHPSSCAREWDALVHRAIARLSAVLWTLRGVGAAEHEQRLRDGVRDLLSVTGDAGGGDDAA